MIPESQRFERFWTPPDDCAREHSNTVNRAKKILGIRPKFYENKIVLDCGCGLGDASRWIKVEGKAKQVYGIDVNPKTIERCITRIKERKDLFFMVVNAYQTSFSNEMFDVILCTEVVEHMDTDELILMINEWKRILKLDGKIWISTPRKRFDKKSYPNGNGSHWIEYTGKELLSIFSSQGLKDEVFLNGEVLWFLLKKI